MYSLIWIDDDHLAVSAGLGPDRYQLEVVSISTLETQRYGILRSSHQLIVAPDQEHIVASGYLATICWKLGQQEPLWNVGMSEPGCRNTVSFGKDWVLLHEKGQTTGARPAMVRSLSNGNQLMRKDNVIATSSNGSDICLVDATGIEIWRSESIVVTDAN